jgi:H+/gluconate symporter-like permease
MMLLSLACTNAIVALPVFAPVVLVVLVLLVHHLRDRRHWDEEEVPS